MTRFTDGPAAGGVLMLKRSPLFLRVVQSGTDGTFDALDQLTDEPRGGERICVYRRVRFDGVAMVDWTEKGRRRGGRLSCATYAFAAEQPDYETMRATDKWRAWCIEQQRKIKGAA